MSFSLRGLLVFVAFAAILSAADDPAYGLAAVAAWAVIELLLWAGVFGWRGASRAR